MVGVDSKMSGVLLRALLVLPSLQLLFQSVWGDATIELNSGNYHQVKESTDILLINFYANWCRFSQQLKPIFEKAAELVADEHLDTVALARVDCEAEKSLCANPFHVTKYPTLMLVRFGEVARREYRGKRSADALVEYVKEQLKDPIEVVGSYYEITSRDVKRAVVGFFSSDTSAEYTTFRKVAINLRDDCPFFAILQQQDPQLLFHEDEQKDKVFEGEVVSLYSVYSWVRDQCIPLVKEITFQNGEEMTEEGVPLLILFYHPDQPETKELFKSRVADELKDQRGSISAVTADGLLFAHPLHHLGKTKHDLPVIAIDSFRHMYVIPNFEDIKLPGKLKAFVEDLHSGKLHREFHHGPDPTTNSNANSPSEGVKTSVGDPPESTFKKLRPDGSRYSLLRDEL